MSTVIIITSWYAGLGCLACDLITRAPWSAACSAVASQDCGVCSMSDFCCGFSLYDYFFRVNSCEVPLPVKPFGHPLTLQFSRSLSFPLFLSLSCNLDLLQSERKLIRKSSSKFQRQFWLFFFFAVEINSGGGIRLIGRQQARFLWFSVDGFRYIRYPLSCQSLE